MSEKMKTTEAVSELLSEEELDRMLAQMAQEAPEMPEDFHARWTNAVRSDETPAAGGAQKQDGTDKRREGRRQWRYVLSAAAVFVFLIGGTLLTRSYEKGLKNNPPAAENVSVMKTETIPQTAAAGLSNTALTAADEAEPAFYAETEEAAEEEAEPEYYAVTEDAAGADDEETAEADRDAGVYAEQAAEAYGAQAVWGDLAAGAAASEESAQEALFSKKSATPTAAATPEPVTEAEESAPAEIELPANEWLSFLKDLGIFTLKTLAAAAAAAALGFGAAAVYRALKKRRDGKGHRNDV